MTQPLASTDRIPRVRPFLWLLLGFVGIWPASGAARPICTAVVIDDPGREAKPVLEVPDDRVRWNLSDCNTAKGVLAIFFRDALFFIDTTTGKPMRTILFKENKNTVGISLSPSAKFACVNFGYDVGVYDVATGECVLLSPEREAGDVKAAFLSPDESKLVIVHDIEPAAVYDATSTAGVRPKKLSATQKRADVPLQWVENQTQLAWFPDNSRVLARSQPPATAEIWDAATGDSVMKLEGHTKPIRHVAISPDGTKAATWSEDLSIILWDAKSGEQLRILDAGVGHGRLQFTADGKALLSGFHASCTLILWDVETGKRLVEMRSDKDDPDALYNYQGVRLYGLSPDGEHAIGEHDGILKFARIRDGRPVAKAVYFRGLEDWLVNSADGRFEASEGGRKRARFRLDGALLLSSDPKIKARRTDGLLQQSLRSGSGGSVGPSAPR